MINKLKCDICKGEGYYTRKVDPDGVSNATVQPCPRLRFHYEDAVMLIDEAKEKDSTAYIRNAVRTESRDFDRIGERLKYIGTIRLLHGAMGAATEAGELLDALKKHIYYGKKLDLVNMSEEVGDLFWYCAIIADVLGEDFELIMKRNIAKLKTRYPEAFKEDEALNRDLEAERRQLEK